MDKETKERFNTNEKRLKYLEKRYLLDLLKIKKALERVCKYKSQLSLVEIGGENLADDIDKEVMPLFNKIIEKLK